MRGFIHSNKFPFMKQDNWYLVFTDEQSDKVFAIEKLTFKEKSFTKEIKQPVQRPGLMKLFLHIRNDSYKGFDKTLTI
jgi:hypothetical protein